jgi:chorismate mutase
MVDPANPVSKPRDLRDSIDNIDAAIVHMLAERFRCTRGVGKLKAQHGAAMCTRIDKRVQLTVTICAQ